MIDKLLSINPPPFLFFFLSSFFFPSVHCRYTNSSGLRPSYTSDSHRFHPRFHIVLTSFGLKSEEVGLEASPSKL